MHELIISEIRYIIRWFTARVCIVNILFVIFSLSSFSQIINGCIVDEKTKESIPYATVFFSGTYFGVSADLNGNFTIDVTSYSSMPLTISAVGYYTSTLTANYGLEKRIVHLTPKLYEIEEVKIEAKSSAKQRRRNLRLFKREFLGSSTNARNCIIINEQDITFNYGSDKDTLRAFARNPLHIENRSLGYNAIYYLDRFEYCRSNKSLYFTGHIIFTKDLNIAESNKQYLSNREKAYRGSRIHFIRELWANDTQQQSFVVIDSGKNLVEINRIVHWSVSNKKYLFYPEHLIIGFNHQRYSEINFKKEKVFFDRFGYFDPSGIQWQGDLARLRIADWLPYNYNIE